MKVVFTVASIMLCILAVVVMFWFVTGLLSAKDALKDQMNKYNELKNKHN